MCTDDNKNEEDEEEGEGEEDYDNDNDDGNNTLVVFIAVDDIGSVKNLIEIVLKLYYLSPLSHSFPPSIHFPLNWIILWKYQIIIINRFNRSF